MSGFESVLVANRGEVARRVFRTARDMGLRTVAVYADADTRAPFVAEADEAVRLDGGYLHGDAIIEAAQRSRARAIHPGYGFLSENAGFARAVADAGLVWVGPSPEVIESMGDKLAAKQEAAAAEVPTLPSTSDPTAGDEVGYPLLVKAAAGGGGKGMRIVESADDLAEAVAAAQREAASAFGDDRVFLERYIARARHIEIQIVGDAHGELVHLGERECSIQRRHQKVIEEAPSAFVTAERRDQMGEAALRLGRAMAYRSAGTVEFLVDDDTGEYFFLEVNTRLQVEHPVTECVTGVDLVRAQLLIAMGQPLDDALGAEPTAGSPSADGSADDDADGSASAAPASRLQTRIGCDGHAIEARLYAEDPDAGFLPATGTVEAFEPASEPVVRWDSGIEAGSVVGVDFDPMLAKVVAHVPSRVEAAGKLARALEGLHLGGLTTNRDFLVAALRHDDFLAGATTTDFIERNRTELLAASTDAAALEGAAIAAALWLQGANRERAQVLAFAPSGWRNARLPRQSTTLASGAAQVKVDYASRRDGRFDMAAFRSAGEMPAEDPPARPSVTDMTAAADGATSTPDRLVSLHHWSPTGITVEIDGHRSSVRITAANDQLHVQTRSSTVSFEVVPRFTVPGTDGPTGGLTAPMPGVVLAVRVTEGETVDAGQVLVVLEAMKMEHHIKAPAAGTVTDVRVTEGAQVDNGAVLLLLDAVDATPDPNAHPDSEPTA